MELQGMARFVSNKDETIRLFQNPVLEYFSHIHPATPVVAFVPVIGVLLYLFGSLFGIIGTVVLFLIGLMLWTFTEYALHRWVFHYHPKSTLGKKIHFLVHGIHHDYPRDSTRLVMPLLVSVPLASAFYFAFTTIFSNFGTIIFAGFIAGYVAYDLIHYATHHLPMKGRVGKFLKTYHMRHHFEDDLSAYGVSNPLWDYVFGTFPVKRAGK